MKKTIFLTSSILGVSMLLVGLGRFVNKTEAYRGDPMTTNVNCDSERHESMIKALKDLDYEAWKALMQGKGRVTQLVTQENFNKFAKMHELKIEGKFDEAKVIADELGLGQGNRQNKNADQQFGRQNGFGQHRVNR